jgi:hypothetical protein
MVSRIAFFDYLIAVRSGRVGEIAGSIRGPCPTCGRSNTGRFVIVYRGQRRCRCVPRFKVCAGSPNRRPHRVPIHSIELFGGRITNRCSTCRKAQQRERYARLQRRPNSIASERHCTACGRTKAAKEFYRNAMYAGGLLSRCKRCHNALTTSSSVDRTYESKRLNRQS